MSIWKEYVVGSGIKIAVSTNGEMRVSVNQNAARLDNSGNWNATASPAQAKDFFKEVKQLKEWADPDVTWRD